MPLTTFQDCWDTADTPALPAFLLPAPGGYDRIRVTAVGGGSDPALYVGATGTVLEDYGTAVAVRWDDATLERQGCALLQGVDSWEAHGHG